MTDCFTDGGFHSTGCLEPSTIEEFDRTEGPRIVTHINHPIMSDGHTEDKSIFCIWLKTYGLASFEIQTSDVLATVTKYNLKG